MVTAPANKRKAPARSPAGRPVAFFAALLLALGQPGRVASYPGEVVFENEEASKCGPSEPHCVIVAQCPQAQRDIRRGQHPVICDWRGTVSLVCCAQPTGLTPPPPVNPDLPHPPPVEPPVVPPVEPPVVPPTEPPFFPPVNPVEPEPQPPVDQTPGTTPSDTAPPPEPPAVDNGRPQPGGGSDGRDPTGAGDDCGCDDEDRGPPPVRTCGLRPEPTESRQRPARLLFDEPVYSLDARRIRRPGLSRRRPHNAVVLLPRQRLSGRQPPPQQQQQRQQHPQSSSEGSWPWMASLVDQANPARRCAGVLLDQQHVLTAAQCFGSDNGRSSAVMLNMVGTEALRRVTSVEPHPSFRIPDGYHDLAVVRFEPALSASQLVPVCLPTVLDARLVLNGSVLDAVSWSNRQRDFRPGSMADKNYRVIPVSNCNNTYAGVDLSPYPAGISDEDFLCTQLTTNIGDECVGIPGSPLMVQDRGHWTLIGLYSFGVACSGTAQYPTVFTRVSPYATWIYEKIGLR